MNASIRIRINFRFNNRARAPVDHRALHSYDHRCTWPCAFTCCAHTTKGRPEHNRNTINHTRQWQRYRWSIRMNVRRAQSWNATRCSWLSTYSTDIPVRVRVYIHTVRTPHSRSAYATQRTLSYELTLVAFINRHAAHNHLHPTCPSSSIRAPDHDARK